MSVALTITGQTTSTSSISASASPSAAVSLAAAGPAAAAIAARSDLAPRVYVAPVDAGYQNRYGFDIRATSSLKFKIVPVPPSTQVEQLRVVPNLVARTFAQTRTLLELYRLGWAQPAPAVGDPPLAAPAATDVVLTQSVAPGSLVQAGEVLVLTFGPP